MKSVVVRLFERERLTDGGRIYLTTFNYLWEVPTRMAERLGWKVPSPLASPSRVAPSAGE